MKNILLTKRDRGLLKWMNRFGFVTIDLIARQLNIAIATAYGRVKKLVDHEYLVHQRVFYGLPGIYFASEKGVEYANSNLPKISNIPKGSYDHDLMATRLMLMLSKKHNCEFITERELKYQKSKNRVGKSGHVADGTLIINNKKIAIEVELNQKSHLRLQKIMNAYMKNFEVDEIWYFCANNQIKKQVSAYQSTCTFLKVLDLDMNVCDITLEKSCA